MDYTEKPTDAQWKQWERVSKWPGTRQDQYDDCYVKWVDHCGMLIDDVEMCRKTITSAELSKYIVEVALCSYDLWYGYDGTALGTSGAVLRLF